MIKSGMFNSVNGDRRYDAREFASYFAMFIGNGVYPNPSNGLQVMSNGDMNIVLKAGNAWIHGYYLTNADDYQMTVDVADGVLNRIDRVVLRLDYLNRKITPLIKKGTFASSPVAPVLKRDADAYEIALADIYVGKGVLSITQANITDLRLNKDLCGIVHGVVNQVDTSEVFHQFQDWMERMQVKGEADLITWTNEQKQAFMNWFNSLRDVLNENAETNILNKIDVLEQNLADHEIENTNSFRDINDKVDLHNADPTKHGVTGAVGGTANVITITPTKPLTLYIDYMEVIFKATANNTGAVTVNISGLGAKSLRNGKGKLLTSNTLVSGSIYTARYNATTGNFILQGEGGDDTLNAAIPTNHHIGFTTKRTWDYNYGFIDPLVTNIEATVYIGGGYYRGTSFKVMNLDTEAITNLDFGYSNIFNGAACNDGTFVYFTGGSNSEGTSDHSQIHRRYDKATSSFTMLAPLPTKCNSGFSCFYNGFIFLRNHSDGNIYKYDISLNTWSLFASGVLNNVVIGTVYFKDDSMYIISADSRYTSKSVNLNTAAVSNFGSYMNVFSSPSVVLGDYVYAFGGQVSGSAYGTSNLTVIKGSAILTYDKALIDPIQDGTAITYKNIIYIIGAAFSYAYKDEPSIIYTHINKSK